MGASDWISAACAVFAAIVGFITLGTVYLAAVQIVSRRQIYRLGISYKSLGPWKKKVASPSLLRMQTQINTPTITVPNLVKMKWQPAFKFPKGFPYIDPSDRKAAAADVEPGNFLARAGWVNFLQALGMDPDGSANLYEMQSQAELVNGIVPMRWVGTDLVAIASLLGFQTPLMEQSNYRNPMPLPTIWSGPIGWLQFRSSSDGCIVEYRRVAWLDNQFPEEIHEYYKALDVEPRPFNLRLRLAHSMGGFGLPSDDYLYLGGTDSQVEHAQELEDKANNRVLSFDEIAEKMEDPKYAGHADEDIRRILFGRNKSKRPGALCGEVPNSQSQIPENDISRLSSEIINGTKKKESKEMRQVMKQCPGLLSVIIGRELASSRGFVYRKAYEYSTLYCGREEVPEGHPYQLGNFCVDIDLLGHIKKAILLLKPDGYYFVPNISLRLDTHQILRYVDSYSDGVTRVFWIPSDLESAAIIRKDQVDPSYAYEQQFLSAMKLCNEFQRMKFNARATYTINDMIIVSQASVSLEKILLGGKHPDTTGLSSGAVDAGSAADLEWALIYSKELFYHLAKSFINKFDLQHLLSSKASIKIKDGQVDCTALSLAADPKSPVIFKVELVGNGTYSGAQLLAAFLQVCLKYFWIEFCFVSNVALFDISIPQTVIMC